MATLDKIFAEISSFSKTMGSLHSDFLTLVRTDIERFIEKTKSLQNQYHWQGWSVIALSAAGASLAIAGSLIPKGANAASAATSADPRLGANDGITDAASKAMKWIAGCLKDNEFLRSTCKTASKFFNGVTPAANIWYQGKITECESKRELLRLCFQEEQQEKTGFSQEAKRAQEAALSILQSKAK
jgi:hypothetical protein